MELAIANNNKVDEYGYRHNYDPDVIDYLEAQIPKMRKMAEIMRAVDYLYSGDIGDDGFLLRVKEVENHWKECEDLATRMNKWNETGDGV